MAASPADASVLSSELWGEVLTKLPSRVDLGAALCTCTALRDAYDANRSAVWEALLSSPRIQPYVGDSGLQGKQLYINATWLRDEWRSSSSSQRFIAFPSFVRCVKVDWESDSLAVGLHDGAVRTCSLWGHHNIPAGEGSHASG